MENLITERIKIEIKDTLEIQKAIYENSEIIEMIMKVSNIIIDAYKNERKTIFAGNGGSAAQAQHLAGEFVGRYYFDRPGLPSIALTTNTSNLTAVANDYGYDKVFTRQIQAIGQEGDIFIAISTSGNSNNILEAIPECKKTGITVVGLTGESGGKMKSLCDFCIRVPSNITPRIQESHLLIGHIICSIVEESIFGKGF